jgi:hypothetical protein
MKASKFSDAQKAFILKQASDGMPVVECSPQIGLEFYPAIRSLRFWK